MRIVITFQQRDDRSYMKLIEMAFASAKRFGYETICVGNCDMGADHHIYFTADNEPYLMNWILAAQLFFIENVFDRKSVLFSPDALILKPLEPVFEQGFDVAFTDRNNPKWPINNGVIYLQPEKKKEIAALWRQAIAMCKLYPIETQEWYGDQLSLWDIYKQQKHLELGLKVALLPCAKYNASPNRTGFIDDNLMKEAYVAHFKGKRKDQMQNYWRVLCSQALS